MARKIGNLFELAAIQLRNEVIQGRRVSFNMSAVIDRAEQIRLTLDEIERLGEI